MTARLLSSAEEIAASRHRWLEARAQPGIVTASEMAAVMDLAPEEYGSAYSVWTEKVFGPDYDAPPTPEMERGRHLEPVIADMYETQAGEELLPGGLWTNDDRPYQAATLDRLDGDGKPVEIKSVASEEHRERRRQWGERGTAVVPLHIRIQALWQMDVRDADEVIIPALKMLPWRLDVYRLPRDGAAERDIKLMREAALEFNDLVARQEPPPLTWAPATARAIKRLHPDVTDAEVRVPVRLARRRASLAQRITELEHRKAQIDNELLARMGSARDAVALDGDGELRRVVRRIKTTRRAYSVPEGELDYLRAGNWRGES